MIPTAPRDLLKERRIEAGMTQVDVCRKVKLPQTTYSSIERGTSNPGPAAEKQLIKMFKLPRNYFKVVKEA